MFEIQDVDTQEPLARIPYEGHRPGYGCNVGNMHTLSGPWFAWVENLNTPSGHPQGSVAPGIVHVLDLASGERGQTHHHGAQAIHGLSVMTDETTGAPELFLLIQQEPDGPMVVKHIQVAMESDAGSPLIQTIHFTGDQVILDNAYAWELDDRDGTSPSVTLWDLRENRTLAQLDLLVPGDHGPPWRLLAGDDPWLVFASDAGEPTRTFLPEDARVWIQDRAMTEAQPHRLPQPEATEDGLRFGSFAVDGDRLYNELWQETLPWFPHTLQGRALPSGGPSDLGVQGLMRGVIIDDGRIVTGDYLDEAPQDPTPWLHENVTRPGTDPPPVERIPAAPLLGVFVLLGAWVYITRSKRSD